MAKLKLEALLMNAVQSKTKAVILLTNVLVIQLPVIVAGSTVKARMLWTRAQTTKMMAMH